MIFLLPALLGLPLGLLLGGRLGNLSRVELRHVWLLILPVTWKLLDVLNVTLTPGFHWLNPVSFVLQLTLLLAFAVLNRHLLGVALVGVGTAANLLVAVANGGFMPVAASKLSAAGVTADARYLAAHHYLANYVAAGPATRLPWLGDWILLPWPFLRVVSPGDLLVLVGTLLAVAAAVRSSPPATQVATGRKEAPAPALAGLVTHTKEEEG